MQGTFKDETGKTYGELFVLRRAANYIEPGTGKRTARFVCQCSCGRETLVLGSDLRRGHIEQCKPCGYEAAALKNRKWSVGDVVNGRTVTALLPDKKYRTCCVTCETVAETKSINPCQVCRRASEAKARAEKKAAHKADVASRTKTHGAECPVCGKHFEYTVVTGSTPPKGCSKRCRMKRRDAIKSGVSRAKAFGVIVTRVDPYKIFWRDNWVCQICKVPTIRSLRGKFHGLSPEIDHRIPLEHSGSHTEENCQTSHRSCNAAKLKADLTSKAWAGKKTVVSVTQVTAVKEA